MKQVNRIVACTAVALGIYVSLESATLQILMANGNPGPGFLPLCIGISMIFVGILLFLSTFGAKADTKPCDIKRVEIYNFAVIIGWSVVVVIVTPYIGIVISLGLMCGIMAWQMGERSKLGLTLLVVLTPALFYLVFSFALGIPLPVGSLFTMS